MLPKRIEQNESVIINLQDYFKGAGTHWVVVYNKPDHKNIEYFDSFALSPPEEMIQFMKTSGKPLEYNSGQIQTMDSIMCGYYCIYYILERSRGRKHVDVLLDFQLKPSLFNELFIQIFANKIM